jgi:hypothetical protein
MSDKSEIEKRRAKAVAFARQINKLTKPGNFEKAYKAVQDNNIDDFRELCKELKITPKLADQMWLDFLGWKITDMSDGWTSGWTS